MKRRVLGGWKERSAVLLASLFLLALPAAGLSAATVNVDVVSDSRGSLRLHPADARGRHDTHRSYVEALQGDRYGIRVTNNTDRRVGVVIAVDGRNIISGKKSDLRNTERMYILPPHATDTYEGWRTGRDTVNRFYFTDPGNSYAAAFGDASAMGVIAVAVYREEYVPPPPHVHERGSGRLSPEAREKDGTGGLSGKAAPGAEESGDRAAAPKSALQARDRAAGTGFGEDAYSPSVKVEFRPERRIAERHFLKYEWRETLCRKGIVDCRVSKNRFWDEDDGYAPYPPHHRRWDLEGN